MNDVPLIQRTDVNSINTSIIAIKKQLKQIEQMLGGIGGTELPTDILYRKDIADAVQEGNNNPVSSGAVDEAIKSLDVSSVGGSGKYISAIEEVDGKINVTEETIATEVTSGNTNSVSSNAVYNVTKRSEKETIVNDLYANIQIVKMNKLIVFYIYAKQAQTSRSYEIPEVITFDGACDTMIVSGTVKGECYISDATHLVISCSSNSSGQIVAFLK